MRLSDCDIRALLPEFMRDDPAVMGLAEVFDAEMAKIDRYSKLQTVWDKIDELSEAELDALADELNLPWYLKDAPVETKRRVIRDSDKVYSKLGTVYAVNEVITAYFSDGEVMEWFDYGGVPYHFRIISDNPLISNEYLQRFLWLLDQVKRRSAHLDGIALRMREEFGFETGISAHFGSRERHNTIEDEADLIDKLLTTRIRERLVPGATMHFGSNERYDTIDDEEGLIDKLLTARIRSVLNLAFVTQETSYETYRLIGDQT